MANEIDETILEASHLTRYFKKIIAVDRISMKLHKGEIVALLGPNGAGKTTLMRMLAGILKPTSGSIFIQSLCNPSPRIINNYLGYCPQRIIIWKDLTCFEQLYFVGLAQGVDKKHITHRVNHLLELFNLQNESKKLAGYLSGGMQRRLSIVIAMVHDPAILILDEPEVGLDPQTRVFLREILRSLSNDTKTTIIFSTHNIEQADKIADRIAVMNQGKLITFDTSAHLKKSAGNTYLLEVSLPALGDEMFNQIKSHMHQMGIQLNAFAKTLYLDADDDGTVIKQVKALLNDLNIKTADINYRQRTLEDIFLTLTGKKLAS